MTFLSPLFLAALGAVALPVAIHLLNKSKVLRIRWAASRFLDAALQRNRRQLQFEDLLLLLLRCLFVALLALAFARPAWLAGGLNVGSGGASTAVLVIDHTASMGQAVGPETRFAQAADAADTILSQLPAGSSVALLFASDQVVRAIAQPTTDFSVVRRTLEGAVPSARGGDLFTGIKDAADLLRPLAGRRDIFVLTDSQAAAWAQQEKIAALRNELGSSISLNILPLAGEPETNLAVTRLDLGASIPAANQPVRCAIEIKNFSPSPATNVRVTLAVNAGEPIDEALIPRIEPNGTATVELFASFRDPGYHTVTASLPADALVADNQRALAVSVVKQLNALVVENASRADGFFLTNALAPVAAVELPRFYLRSTPGSAAALTPPNLENTDLVVLTDAASLPASATAALLAYVRAGGALFVFPGQSTDVSFFNEDPDFAALLPARLGPIENTADTRGLPLASRDHTHPVATLWNDPESGDLGAIRLNRFLPLTPRDSIGDSVSVLLRLADGRPVALTREVGSGRVALFATAANTDWSNLPVSPSFIPLLHRLVAWSTQRAEPGLVIAPGQPFIRTFPTDLAGRDFSILRTGDPQGRRVAGKIESADTVARIRFDDTASPGGYALFAGDEPRPLITFAVQVDVRESDLTPVSPETTSTSPDLKTQISDLKSAASAAIAAPREIWPWVIAAALLLALVETALAHRFSQAK
ncbi:MAG: hypothetical protein K0R17_741 [Rariglobus sp.]|jgi:hypothetical protein|nr:hypothetical protein [Rariglobus sp.]